MTDDDVISPEEEKGFKNGWEAALSDVLMVLRLGEGAPFSMPEERPTAWQEYNEGSDDARTWCIGQVKDMLWRTES